MLKYFAYGSNLLSGRLQARVPSARPLGVAQLGQHTLEFSKRSFVDGSGKCTIIHTGQADNTVWGVVFEMDPRDRPALDRAEGLGNGYRAMEVEVLIDGRSLRVFTYIVQGTHHQPGLVPLDWYRALVLAGAEEHGLPADYIAGISAVAAEPDPDEERAARLWDLVEKAASGK